MPFLFRINIQYFCQLLRINENVHRILKRSSKHILFIMYKRNKRLQLLSTEQ